ncbi:SURF1 family protein [Flexivirga alba]|uniref:SURF1-like protein n=1 Tax=Flexivirga alba TaxID=702742 RepID=A0ABW2AK55_9MICO
MTWLLVALIWAAASVFLGRWQWHRYEAKSLSQHQLTDNYNAKPVAVTSILPDKDTKLSADDTWRQVKLVGHYQAANLLLVRNRPNDGVFGYELVIPFQQADGPTVLVDRGWLDNGRTAAAPTAVPPTPSGTVTVVGWLKPGEPATDNKRVPGQVSSINLNTIATRTNQSLLTGGYVLMRSEMPAAAATTHGLAPLPKPTPGTYAGINLSYALQWWAAAIGGILLMLYQCRKEELEAVRGPKPKKPKKVRIWDEEDE